MIHHGPEDHHAYLKFPRLIFFNLNGALSIAATALASQSLVNSHHDQRTLAAAIPGAVLHIDNAIGAGSAMTGAAGLCSLYTGFMAILITFKIQRMETKRSIMLKEIAMVIMAALLLTAAIVATVIIIPRSAGVSAPGIPQATLIAIIKSTGKSIRYRDTLLFPALIVTWICFGTTIISFVLAAMAQRHIARYGPENALIGHAASNKYRNGQALVDKDEHGSVSHNERM